MLETCNILRQIQEESNNGIHLTTQCRVSCCSLWAHVVNFNDVSNIFLQCHRLEVPYNLILRFYYAKFIAVYSFN